ncbi:chromosomal replication initiator protein DnaA [Candidatus Gottesmanbacteria bacterium CG11_big_fil_rev_8_21_14_0_20_37_11]|uniref:Chromosomal replication initiator protein DnaA n=1 Tax=Candidatus Gottesmanbacteria bacterium CG11_big_fil_rev_8_21_14_0_20_37_11 TaxID=1974575 RepID=A0A2H0NGR6_9BACT|nr:MAG: chromosomal replication initiator protein DnaA [Candidatus Gottesmanbacteria bacterium CG23_combo_of_CG06-09_8_20_14_all_37_19]PIR08077.1 MAG: chromosomal replication initiator protein DnaA [Candidatus Gottesmanbacteria bacterium CG11_big_fil_rev_8_21_14_0_20_37_11]
MDTRDLWQAVISDIELQVSKAVFQALISQTTLVSFSDQTVTIGCKKPMLVNLIEKRYHDLFKKTIDLYSKSDNRLIFTTVVGGEKKENIDGPLFTLRIPEEKIFSHQIQNIKLNPDYTFDNFAVSSSNQMAYAAATAVANNPGSSYNPLFLYGGVGVGKTHLMQAIAHVILVKNPKTRVIYCTSEEFTNEIIEAIGNKTTTSFKKKYRQLDMFLIDDVQFIAGKYSIQEEFFHTFNAIQQVKGQIILTSDKPPEEINKLEARLKSRFEGGLTIDIGQPDFELRTAILLIKAKKQGVDLPINLAKLLAANIEDTRKLTGVLIRILSESKIKDIPMDEKLIKEIIGKSLKNLPLKNHVTPSRVIDVVSSYYNIKLAQLKGNKRDKFLSQPRQILYYILRVELGIPLMEIGDILGGRDHTTILHGVRKISKILSTDEKIRGDVLGIKNRIFG